MAAGFKYSADLGANKVDITVAASTAGTAGVEVNIDPAKFTTRHACRDALLKIAELITEADFPPA